MGCSGAFGVASGSALDSSLIDEVDDVITGFVTCCLGDPVGVVAERVDFLGEAPTTMLDSEVFGVCTRVSGRENDVSDA